MCYKCSVNHKIDIPVCTLGIGMVVGFGWSLGHAYTGQPFIEAFIPVAIIAGLFALVGIIIGIGIWKWERRV